MKYLNVRKAKRHDKRTTYQYSQEMVKKSGAKSPTFLLRLKKWLLPVTFLIGTFIYSAVVNCKHYGCDTPASGKAEDLMDTAGSSTSFEMPDSAVQICLPLPLKDVPEVILRRRAYVVSYNKDTRNPNWVAWHLTGEHADGPYPRSDDFHEDEEVECPRATLDDYRRSGWSRGHMCPAGDNKWDEAAMHESFSLVNICPQDARLNSGLWNSIEMDCREWARRYGDIYIVCGPVYLNREHEAIGSNRVVVPEAFFKVVLCLNGVPKAFGIVVRNNSGQKKRDLYYNSVDEVERITGMDFFCNLPDEVENKVEATANIGDW